MYLQSTDILCPPPRLPSLHRLQTFSSIPQRLLLFYAIIFIINELSIIHHVGAVQLGRSGGGRVIASFSSATQINNFEVVVEEEGEKGRIFLGSVNHLYSLRLNNLSLLEDASTGPIQDSPLCNSELTSCVGPLGRGSITSTDNWNKILHYIPQPAQQQQQNRSTAPGVLLVCGSTRQGVCQLHSSAQLSQRGRSVGHPNFVGFQHTSVAANSPNASTVSLLLSSWPDGATQEPQPERLFVASTYSTNDRDSNANPYRDSFPAVATRLGPAGLLPINSGSIEGEAAVYIRERFKVHYVAAFRDERYLYWASVQRKNLYSGSGQHVANPSVANPLVSRLIRVCQDDDKYMSYSEIEIQCRSGTGDNTNFNILKAIVLLGDDLIGVFTDAEEKQSAICIFNMPKIRLTFWYNIDRCRAGTDSIGLPHIGRDSKCINKSHLPLSEDTCQLGVGGTIEASQLAAEQYSSGRVLTAVDAKMVDDQHALVLVGTSKGEILQIRMTGSPHNRRLENYAEYVAGSGTIDKVKFLDEKRFLVVNNKELLMMKVSMCSSPSANTEHSGNGNLSATCDSCISNKDPLCGWCIHEGQCLRQSECQSPLLKKCPKLVGPIQPQNLSITAPISQSVFVPVKDLPRPSDPKKPYECFFGVFKSTPAGWTSTGLNCPLPLMSQRPRIEHPGISEMEVTLAVRSSSSRANIVAQSFVFYNCALFSVCSLCTTSKWPCRWCAADHKCLNSDDGQEMCSSSTGSTKCAKIDTQSAPEILIADSTNSSVTFGVLNMEQSGQTESSSSRLYCTIIPSTSSYFGAGVGRGRTRLAQDNSVAKVRVPATLHADRVQCSSAFYNYPSDEPYLNYTLELAMGTETIDKTSVTMYKCSVMASDCSSCLSLDPKWRCIWCEGQCRYHTHSTCRGQEVSSGANNADLLCTRPIIESFHPRFGPTDGGTLIEINGRDLGSRIQDVQDRVYVGGSKCRMVDYQVSRKITCVLERGTGHGPVRITIGRSGRRSVESSPDQHYQFLDPLPKSIYPVFGPMAGGTRLLIHGDNLNIGGNISVHLDNLPCQVINEEQGGGKELPSSPSDRGQIACLTSPSIRPYTITAIRVQIDDTVRLLHAKYTYRPDPTVLSMDPLASFESGGRLLNVVGTNFDSILSAKLYLLSSAEDPAEIVSDLGQCQIHNSTQMQCQSPRLTLSPTLRQSTYNRWAVGFHMDGLKSVRNLGSRLQLTTLPDPQLSAFKGVKVQSAEQPLILEGNFLSQAAGMDDYIVTVGTEPCSVFVLDAHQLLCRLPSSQPAATDDSGLELEDGHPLVVVKIGSLRMEIGPIEYDYNGLSTGGLVRMNLLKLVLLLLCAFGVLLLAGLMLVWLWRRRNNEHERVYKRIQMQMEQMESSVRNECKQAFAELQTDMLSDLTSAMDDGIGIPYQSKAEFVSRLLFRDSADATLMNGYGGGGVSAYSSQLPMALAQFDSLLWNRQFIFLFVHMIETDPSVSASERSTLSSLLLVSLSRNMVYCTDVILSLLSAHIERTSKTPTAHLLFRRSESLVEKLFQQWLTICMYPYLNDISGPGKNFFLLYKALKYQTEKGPIDCVTDNARYSLSEQKLLRESVDAVQVTLLVIPSEGFDQAPVVCKVLGCDTISQVKSKLLDLLYKNTPFSARITTDQFDLYWESTKKGTVLLLDDDKPEVKGLKRLKTVSDYNLPHNAMIAMQFRNGCGTGNNNNHQSFTFRSGSSDTTASVWSSAQLIETTSSVSPTSNHNHSSCSDSSNHTTYWHLVHPGSSTEGYGSTAKRSCKKKTEDGLLGHHISQCKKNSAKSLSRSNQDNGANGAARNIPEVYLTRLLMCKGTIQRFVEGFFDSVMFADDSNATVSDGMPIVMKYVLDYLDEEAARNNITDPDTIHAWKTNAIVLRLWMQLIHNADSIFDVQRQPCVDASMTVVGQTLMDAFSRSDVPLGKESPSSKLLFAKEISRYRPIAAQMFRRFKNQQPSISNKQFYEYIGAMSKFLGEGLSSTAAVGELLNWVKANGLRLVELLEQDQVAVKHRLGDRLRQLIHCSIVEPEHIYATLQ